MLANCAARAERSVQRTAQPSVYKKENKLPENKAPYDFIRGSKHWEVILANRADSAEVIATVC